MRKVVAEPVKIGENKSRHTFKLYSDDCPEGLASQMKFLQELVDQPALLLCGPTYAQKWALAHNGQCWVMAAESEAHEA